MDETSFLRSAAVQPPNAQNLFTYLLFLVTPINIVRRFPKALRKYGVAL